MLKAFYFKYGYKKNDIIFAESIEIKKRLWQINPLIYYSKTGDIIGYFLYIFGKKIKAIVLFKTGDRENLSFEIGTLNSINDLINRIRIDITTSELIEKIYLNGKEISIRNESLSSIGITKDFVCEVELKKKYTL